MKYTLSELNNASTIILDAKGFLKIKIDKKEGIITEVSKMGKESNIDVTQEILDIESNYSIGDIVVDTPYSLGMVVAKLFKGNANNKCKKALNIFDEIILE